MAAQRGRRNDFRYAIKAALGSCIAAGLEHFQVPEIIACVEGRGLADLVCAIRLVGEHEIIGGIRAWYRESTEVDIKIWNT